MIAVAQVTITRLRSGRWGTTLCEVIHKPYQFSWTIKRKRETPHGKLWERAKLAVEMVTEGGAYHIDVGPSLFYHADYIEPPDWASQENLFAQVGQHLFYEKDVIR